MKELTTSYVLVTVQHTKPIESLHEHIAGRTHTLDGVEFAEARILQGGMYLLPVVDRGAWYGGPKEAKA